jgi:hypothetical protein
MKICKTKFLLQVKPMKESKNLRLALKNQFLEAALDTLNLNSSRPIRFFPRIKYFVTGLLVYESGPRN